MSGEIMVHTAEEMLKPFTDPESCRYGLSHQWITGGWRQATDARIAARIKTDEPDFEPTDDQGRKLRFPNMESIFGIWKPDFESLAEFIPLSRIECVACNKTGRRLEECEECYGEGRLTCSKCDHEDDCPHCDGSGQASKPCYGCKNITVTNTREIDVMYWYRIQALGDVSIRHVKDMSLFVFKCGDLDGQGIVMHRKTDQDCY